MSSKKARSIWPWAIVITLVIFATFMVGVSVYISSDKFQLVSEDYYDETLKYEETIEQKKALEKLNAPPSVQYSFSDKVLSVSFPEEYRKDVKQSELKFYRPDDPAKDFSQTIDVDESGSFSLSTQELKFGNWKMTLKWKLGEQSYFIEQDLRI